MSAARHHRANRGLFYQRSLALEDAAQPAPPQPVSRPVRQRLWFCIYLPNLPLEAAGPVEHASAVVEDQHGIHRVMLADEDALAAGIMPGQSANAALALLPTLRLIERSELSEQQALERLATWLEQFTSVVCFAGPDVLLLEIAGSLRLYGGLRSLRRQVAAGLEQQGFAASLAIAPTPLAATWLARGRRRVCIREPENLPAALRKLPVACLDWPLAVNESLAGMGIRNLGDCLRLPREGLARRFGPERLLQLDRALGRLPDPRTSWRAPERFCASHEMTEEQGDRERLLAICHELLQAHERFLLARQLGTQQLLFSFFHLRAPATHLQLGGAQAERLAEHWFDLLQIRFDKLVLPEPVIAVQLRGGHASALSAASGRFRFQVKAGGKGLRYSMSQLAERLVARLGIQSISGVTTVAEHRPQRAFRLRSLMGDGAARLQGAVSHDACRPLWMLPEPTLLPVERGHPSHQGRLRILEGPERLETGWWDDDSIARDYFTAVNPQGMRLWVFRNRSRESSWYLHGLFG
jgi:protein ImuB